MRSRSSRAMPGPESATDTATVPVPARVDDGLGLEGSLVLDPPATGLLAERLVGLLEQPRHLDLVLLECELTRVEAREIEDVADEPGEAIALGADHVERRVACVGILGEALTESL